MKGIFQDFFHDSDGTVIINDVYRSIGLSRRVPCIREILRSAQDDSGEGEFFYAASCCARLCRSVEGVLKLAGYVIASVAKQS